MERIMNSLIVEEDGKRTARRHNGDSQAFAHDYAQHRRSKSASDRNLNISKERGSPCTQRNTNESPVRRIHVSFNLSLSTPWQLLCGPVCYKFQEPDEVTVGSTGIAVFYKELQGKSNAYMWRWS